MPGSRPFLVRELIEDTGFELELVAGAAGTGRECHGVYIGEHLDPTPWMARGSIHLTAGLALADAADPAEGPRLLQRLHAAGMTGLGVSIPHYLPSIPAAMRAEADRLGLPLFSVTGDTLFRDIEQYVYDAMASEEMHRLRRSLSAQQQLLELMAGEDAPAALTARLGALLGAAVLLYDAEGALLAGAGAAGTLPERVWGAYLRLDRAARPRAAFAVDGRGALWREAVLDGRLRLVLVALPGAGATREFADTVLDYAERLLEVDLRRREPPQADAGALLLRDVLRAGADDGRRVALLAEAGIAEGTPYRVVVARPLAAKRSSAPAALAAAGTGWEAPLVRGCVSHLAVRAARYVLAPTAEGGAVALAAFGRGAAANPGAGLAAELAAALEAEGAGCAVGSSEECRGSRLAPAAYRHALQAALWAADRVAPESAMQSSAQAFELLGARRRLLDAAADAELAALAGRLIAPLEAADAAGGSRLVASLACYLRHDRSVGAAAAELYVHRNTLCKRLARVERTLGLRFDSVDDLLDVRLAFDAADVLWSRRAAEVL